MLNLIVPQHGSWKTGFNKDTVELHEHWKDTLPEQADILITHTPSKGKVMPDSNLNAQWYDVIMSVARVVQCVCVRLSTGVGDREPWGHSCGCPHLLKEVARLKPKYHVFGHIHSDYGVHKVSLRGVLLKSCLLNMIS